MLRIITLLAFTSMISGCLIQETVPHSVADAYPDTPIKTNIRGSSQQKIIVRSYPFSRDEVFDAVQTGALRLGLNTEKTSREKGLIVVSGQITVRSDGATWPFSLAFYIEQISPRPETRLTIIIDRYKGSWGWEPNDKALTKTTRTIQEILSTY